MILLFRLMILPLIAAAGEPHGQPSGVRPSPAALSEAQGNDSESLCLSSFAAFRQGDRCDYLLAVEPEGSHGLPSVDPEKVCTSVQGLAEADSLWVLSTQPRRSQALYQLNCLTQEASPLNGAAVKGAPPPLPLDSSNPSEEEKHPQLSDAEESQLQLAKPLEGPESLRPPPETSSSDLKAEEDPSPAPCTKVDSLFLGRREVMVSVSGSVLRFLQIQIPEPVVVGLERERAGELYREAHAGQKNPLPPWLLRSVPAVERTVAPFLLQDRLVGQELFSDLLNEGSVQEVSYEAAERFLAGLNQRCSGVARFDLPTEEEMVAAIKLVYNPNQHGLLPCQALKDHGRRTQLDQLLGSRWQLTRSRCEPFSEQESELCPPDTYVRKGGTAESNNPLECLPEYRSTAVPNVAQKDTGLRLVLRELR